LNADTIRIRNTGVQKWWEKILCSSKASQNFRPKFWPLSAFCEICSERSEFFLNLQKNIIHLLQSIGTLRAMRKNTIFGMQPYLGLLTVLETQQILRHVNPTSLLLKGSLLQRRRTRWLRRHGVQQEGAGAPGPLTRGGLAAPPLTHHQQLVIHTPLPLHRV
jgi:hypothetical protein